MPDEVVVTKHLHHGVGQGDSDSKGKTLGNGNDDHGDGGNEVVDKVGKEVAKGEGGFQVDKVLDHEEGKGGDGKSQTKLADLIGEDIELLLKRGVLRLNPERHHDLCQKKVWILDLPKALCRLKAKSYLSIEGVGSHSDNQDGSVTFQHLASREKEGILLRLCDGVRLASGSRLVTLNSVTCYKSSLSQSSLEENVKGREGPKPETKMPSAGRMSPVSTTRISPTSRS